jgi:hypothetical protein
MISLQKTLLSAASVALALVALAGPPLAVGGALQADGGEALRAAASSGDVGAVGELLAQRVDVDDANEYGATALILAALNGHAEVVRALLDAGADPDLADAFYGRSPLEWATLAGSDEVVSMLFVAGSVDFDALFMQAVDAGNVEQVAELLRMQVPPAEVLSEALRQAIAMRNEPLGLLLIDAGAVPPPPPIISIDAARLRLYEGRYVDEVGYELVIIADEQTRALLVRPPGMRNPLRFLPIEEATFISEQSVSISIRFTVRDGRVVSMSFTQAGATRRMSKQ